MVGMAYLTPILVSFCPVAPTALDVTRKRSEMLSSDSRLDENGVTMRPRGRCEMQEETMNLKHLIVAVPAALCIPGNGTATPDKPSTKRALSPA